MNPLPFLQSKFLHDEEKIMKIISEPKFKNITRYKDYSQIELSKLHMYDVFYNIIQSSLKDLKLHYMETDSFVLSYTEGKVSDEHMDLSNLDPPIKTNQKIPW